MLGCKAVIKTLGEFIIERRHEHLHRPVPSQLDQQILDHIPAPSDLDQQILDHILDQSEPDQWVIS